MENQKYRTILGYGLTKEENAVLAQMTKEPYRSGREGVCEQFRYIPCDGCFSDLLALPCFLIAVNPQALSEREFEMFNEIFGCDDSAAIAATGTFPGEPEFSYYRDLDFSENKAHKALLFSYLVVFSRKKGDVRLDPNADFSVISMCAEKGSVTVSGLKIRNGKIQLKNRISTADYDEFSAWLGEDTLVGWYPNTRALREWSNGRLSANPIDAGVLFNTSYPMLIHESLNEKTAAIYGDMYADKAKEDKIALLFLKFLDKEAP